MTCSYLVYICLISSNESQTEPTSSPMTCSQRLSGELEHSNELTDHDVSPAPQTSHCTTYSPRTIQSNRDCQILTLMQPNSPEEQKLYLILSFTKFRPPSTYKFPTKLEYGKNRAF